MTEDSNNTTQAKKWRDRFAWLVIINMIVVIAVGVTLGVIFDKYIRNAVIPKNFAQVDDKGLLYRSGELDHNLIEPTLREHHIQTVVTMLSDSREALDAPNARTLNDVTDRLGLRHEYWPLGGDGTGELEHYIGAVKAVKRSYDAGEPVLVHCAAGSYRTGGVYAIWRLFIDGWPAQRVRDEMIYYGGGDREIVDYLNEHMDTIAHRLVEEGVIDRVPDPLPKLPY